MENRLARGKRARAGVPARLRGSGLPKKTQARVVETCVGASMLFNAACRVWRETDVGRVQRFIDSCYRWVWASRRVGILTEMQQKGVNSYGIRQELGVRSVQAKVEEQVLTWVGHAARMGEERLAKVASQGWMKVEDPPKGRRGAAGGVVGFWRKVLAKAGMGAEGDLEVATSRERWGEVLGKFREAHGKFAGRRASWHTDRQTKRKPPKPRWAPIAPPR